MSGEHLGPSPSLAADRLAYDPAWVYLLRCTDGSLYAGWTNDLARRLHAHRTGAGGAKYTQSHGKAAVQLAYAEVCADKSAALKREAALKKLPKAQKEALAADWAARSRLTLRMATPDDAADVVALYNWYVTHGTQTFQYEPSTEADYRQNITEVLEKAPFLVAYTADGRLAGYACAHPWHTRRSFAWDVETTVYCAHDVVGRGTGRKLYTALLELLRRQGYHNAFALVTRPNPQSDAFHKALGFTRYGVEKNSGYKFGRWLDLGYWAYPLNPPADPPAPVRFRLPDAEVAAVLAELQGKE